MTPHTLQGQLLSAELRGDDAEQRRLRAAWTTDAWDEVIPVAFALAVRRRFGRYGDRRVTTRFAKRFVARAPEGTDFKAREVEAVLRGVSGEDALLATVDPGTAGGIMHAGLVALVDDLDLDDDAVNQLVVAAEQQISAAYRAVGTPPDGPPDAPRSVLETYRRTHRRYLRDEDLLPDRQGEPRRPRAPQDDSSTAGRKRREVSGPVSLAGRYLRASMLRDTAERDSLGTVPSLDLTRVFRSALIAALPRYLHPDPSLPEITALVLLARDTFHAELDVLKTEYVARAALDEDVPIDGLTSKDVFLACSLMLMVIADWWGQDEAAISDVVVAAEERVAESGHRLARWSGLRTGY